MSSGPISLSYYNQLCGLGGAPAPPGLFFMFIYSPQLTDTDVSSEEKMGKKRIKCLDVCVCVSVSVCVCVKSINGFYF